MFEHKPTQQPKQELLWKESFFFKYISEKGLNYWEILSLVLLVLRLMGNDISIKLIIITAFAPLIMWYGSLLILYFTAAIIMLLTGGFKR